METFAVDKSFYDIGASDLKELWDSDLDPTMHDVFRSESGVEFEWGSSHLMLSGSGLPKENGVSGIVLHDRLMTDAALGTCTTIPIKTEHSYSLASDGDSLPDSPISPDTMDEGDEDCFHPITVNMNNIRRITASNETGMIDVVNIKDEPLSEPDSPNSSCPASPNPQKLKTKTEYQIELDPMLNGNRTLLKHEVMLTTRPNIFATHPSQLQEQKVVIPKINIKVEPGTSGFILPPTPPSCSSSEDSEDNASQSQPASPGRPPRTAARMLIAPQAPTRQPIHTPLISSQPKGSTGQLVLTEEEKRTLLAEGYPVPTRLPLTKAEEKSLKKIRRKIKNKISAQESRRKKKEYMDQLERKVEILVSENTDYRKKIETLEDSNANLLSQLTKLQALVARTHPQTTTLLMSTK